ncbi:MAG TPA: hypothetical protein VNT75_28485 [Symbiobacteriaceae bacterium]|nr:hypothetical protein [Symbiobacteriaceae bacterium]
MSEPSLEPVAAPPKWRGYLTGTAKTVGLLVLVAAVSAASAWGVFSWRIRAEQQGTAEQVAALRLELREQQDKLAEQVTRVEKAAQDAKVLLDQSGQTTTLDARLKEIDTLKLDLKKTQDDMEAKLKAVEKSVVDQVAKQSKETAQALSAELRWKSLLVKAQGEILLAQVHWAEGNRGLAKDELSYATRTLQQARDEATEPAKSNIAAVADQAERAKSALILEQSSARDSLNLLWHQVSELLATNPKS